jgi:hypothetical protein
MQGTPSAHRAQFRGFSGCNGSTMLCHWQTKPRSCEGKEQTLPDYSSSILHKRGDVKSASEIAMAWRSAILWVCQPLLDQRANRLRQSWPRMLDALHPLPACPPADEPGQDEFAAVLRSPTHNALQILVSIAQTGQAGSLARPCSRGPVQPDLGAKLGRMCRSQRHLQRKSALAQTSI